MSARHHLFRTCVVVVILFAAAAGANAVPPVRLVTYNVSNNRPKPAAIVGNIRALTAEPPIVAMQEARAADIPAYRAALGRAYPGTKWSSAYQGYNCEYTDPCYKTDAAIDPRHDSDAEGVALLSPFPARFETRRIPAHDRWWLARAAVRARVEVPGAGTISVIVGHGPVGGSGSEASFIKSLTAWAAELPPPRFLGGDFNVSPTQGDGTFYAEIAADGWTDAWSAFTGSPAGGETKRARIDYWFSQTGAGEAYHPEVMTIGRLGASDHRPLYAGFASGAVAAHREWSLHDDFDAGAIDADWTPRLFSSTENARVPVTAEAGALTIHLLAGVPSSHYAGVRSIAAFPFQEGEASVDLVCAPSPDARDSYAMFTVGSDARHFYRWYVTAGQMQAEKNAGSGKKPLGTPQPFDTGKRRLRIRHDLSSGHVVFEHGTDGGDWQVDYEEPWAAQIPLQTYFELKGGTSAAEASPGRVCWDGFDAKGR
jgi:endonuclease/exonuclease/phosphatase family metal-dependent hydrolase